MFFFAAISTPAITGFSSIILLSRRCGSNNVDAKLLPHQVPQNVLVNRCERIFFNKVRALHLATSSKKNPEQVFSVKFVKFSGVNKVEAILILCACRHLKEGKSWTNRYYGHMDYTINIFSIHYYNSLKKYVHSLFCWNTCSLVPCKICTIRFRFRFGHSRFFHFKIPT